MLALEDQRWKTLQTAYHMPADDVVAWLSEAYRSGMNDELLGDIVNEIQHQGDTSEAMYATAPHLLALSEKSDEIIARQLIIVVGLICAASESANAVPCPDDLELDFKLVKTEGKKKTLVELSKALDFDDFKYLVAALAGFSGHERFGRLLEGFEIYDDQFHHPLLDEPIDDEP